MLCVGLVGLDHVRSRPWLGRPYAPAVIHPSPAELATTSQVSAVVAEVDNGVVLRARIQEARLRGVRQAVAIVHAAETPDDVEQQPVAYLSRRLFAHWLPALPRGAWIAHRRGSAVIWPPPTQAGSAVRRGLTLRARIVRCIPLDAPYLRNAVPTL